MVVVINDHDVFQGSSATEKSPAKVATRIEDEGLLGRSQRDPRLPADGGVETFNEMQADLTRSESDSTVGPQEQERADPATWNSPQGGAG